MQYVVEAPEKNVTWINRSGFTGSRSHAKWLEHLKGLKKEIEKKDGSSLVGNMAAQGTTPRRLTDLIGSLCDLTSGSGDKGTPIVYIQGYFDNYTAE